MLSPVSNPLLELPLCIAKASQFGGFGLCSVAWPDLGQEPGNIGGAYVSDVCVGGTVHITEDLLAGATLVALSVPVCYSVPGPVAMFRIVHYGTDGRWVLGMPLQVRFVAGWGEVQDLLACVLYECSPGCSMLPGSGA